MSTKYQASRIQGAIEQLLNEGLLSRRLSRSRDPAGAIVVRRMVTALYKDAITKGTNGWDTTLNDIAKLLLLACLGSWSGDLMGDTKDVRPDLPSLRYSDVQITVHNLNRLRAQFKIRSSKGQKRVWEQVGAEMATW